MSISQPDHYNEHSGTVRISGRTLPKSAAFCALTYLQRGLDPIDFFYIGGNAGQQAMKAMSIFAYLVDREMHQAGISVAFCPKRFTTNTVDPVTKENREKDAAVWRTIIVKQNGNLPVNSDENIPIND